ncbi:hypothetical protein HDU89_008391 [Geranomyces variabilis]|nr:hypothetical protein HDU89_008391 [Geranomyces variabilis]
MHMLLIRELDLVSFESRLLENRDAIVAIAKCAFSEGLARVVGVFFDNKEVCRWVMAAGTWKSKSIRTFTGEWLATGQRVPNPWPKIVKTCLQRGHFDLLRGIWTKDLDVEVWGDLKNTWTKDVASGLRGEPSGL